MQRDTMVHSMNLLTFCNNSKYFFDYTNTLVIILLTTALATHGGGHDNWFLRHKCTSHNIAWHPKKKGNTDIHMKTTNCAQFLYR